MSIDDPKNSDSPDHSFHAENDALCDRFESAWKSGKRPRIEEFLVELAERVRPAALRELLLVEIELRRGRGESPTLAEYQQRFADYQTSVEEVFASRDGGNLETIAHTPSSQTRGLHVRCPHCHNPIELLPNADLKEVNCPSCNSSFSISGYPTAGEDQRQEADFAHFKLIERLGVGAFGAVWKAQDTQLDRTVALKIPRQGGLDSQQAENFLREARAAAQLKHPNIVSVHEIGREGERVYIVSDLVEGGSLAERLEGGPLTSREAAELCAKIAEALEHAHQKGVIHRDLKPANILLDDSGNPLLADFGLAKREAGEITMTMEGQVVGTPAYMSPEQAQGDAHDADARSDVYSLGVILFELLTGELPFRGSVRMLLKQVIEDEPPTLRRLNSSVPKDLETICLKCMEKQPGRRYGSAAALADDLRRFLRNDPILARPPSAARIIRVWLRQNFGLIGWAAVTGTLFGVFLGACGAVFNMLPRIGIIANLLEELNYPIDNHFVLRWQLPSELLWLDSIYSAVLIPIGMSTVGLVTVLLVKPQNSAADMAAGLLSGTIAAVACFACLLTILPYIGFCGAVQSDIWNISGLGSIRTTPLLFEDLELWTLQFQEDQMKRSNELLLEKYPGLDDVAPDNRAAAMNMVILYNGLAGTILGLLVALALSVPFAVPACLFEAMIAGPLMRRGEPLVRVIPLYLERAVPLAVLIVALAEGFIILIEILSGAPSVRHRPTFLICGAATSAMVGVFRSWHMGVRAVLHLTWIAPLISLVIQDYNAVIYRSQTQQREYCDLLCEFAEFERGADHFDQLIEKQPHRYEHWYAAASARLRAGDLKAYQETCLDIVERFANTDDPLVASSVSKICLLGPNEFNEESPPFELAERAMLSQSEHPQSGWIRLSKAIAEYRAAKYAQAETLLEQLVDEENQTERVQISILLLAMSKWQLGDHDKARQIFADALDYRKEHPIRGRSGSWIWRAHADVIQREADQLIGPKQANGVTVTGDTSRLPGSAKISAHATD